MKDFDATGTVRTMTPETAQEYLRDEAAILVDVRGYDEFASGHAMPAACVPLPELERRSGELPTDRPVFVICQSGTRSAIAAERLRALGMDKIVEIEGGLNAWVKAGLPTARQTAAISLERQVRIAAGVLVLCFTVIGFVRDRRSFYGAGFIGMMLSVTGMLNICPMMSILRYLPWNRVTHQAS